MRPERGVRPQRHTLSGPACWKLVAPGVWRLELGAPAKLTPLSASGSVPSIAAMDKLPSVPFPIDVERIAAERTDLRAVVRLPLENNEEIYGLGLQFMRVEHRGRTRYLRVNSDPCSDTGETHAPVPFYVTSRGYGVLVDTARIPTIYCGSCVRRDAARAPEIRDRGRDDNWAATPTSDAVEVVVPGGNCSIYMFAGPTPLDAVRRYNLFCGGGALPPRWGLGFWHRVNYRHNAAQAIAAAEEYRKRQIPCDVIGLEPGWHSASYPCTFEWSKDRFPRPAEFIRAMRQRGVRVNLWEHAYISPKARIHAALLPYAGSHTVWGGIVPDYSIPAARRILQRQHQRAHVSIGVSGYKLDECDGSELTGCSWMFPGHATFPSGHDGEELRQVYGLLFQRTTAELIRRSGRRTYGLVRASNAGASCMPYVLYSDLYDHRQFVRALCNSGFSGLLWAPEVRDTASAEELVRRTQVACFSPLTMLNAWACDTAMWTFPEVEPIIRSALQLRMRLMPYFYSAFARYHFDGTPPFRAMALETGRGACDDQYMAGDSLLVAPLFAGQTERNVLLPDGRWHDFHSGVAHEGGRSVRVVPGLETIPVFVRDGGVLPLMPPLHHAPAAGEAVPLEVLHYGNVPGRFELFDDDGETFAYERGKFRWRTLEVAVSPDGKRTGSISPVGSRWRSSYGNVEWRFLP